MNRTRCPVCLGSGKTIPQAGGVMQMANMPCLTCNGNGWLEMDDKDPKESEGLHTPSIPFMPDLPPPPPGPRGPPPVPRERKKEQE